MSVQDAKKFVDEAEKDPELRKAGQQHWDSIAAAAKKHGLSFTRSELQQHLREKWSVPQMPAKDDVDTCTIA
jgi:predicted ribosomally synthesized peptide with nif11-like leader